MRTLFVLNPGSKSGTSRKRFDTIRNLVASAGMEAEFLETKTLEDARIFSERGNEEGFDCIVAVGGDGTINNVLGGMFHSDGRRRSDATMGVVYTGTSPDFCRSYGIPLDLVEAMNLIQSGRSTPISVGRVEMAHGPEDYVASSYLTDKVLPKVAFFGCCANVGLGAELARRANGGIRKKLGDTMGTFISLLGTIASFDFPDVCVRVDGRVLEHEKLCNISIGRTHLIASGIKVHNDLELDDDRFYLLTIKEMVMAKWPKVIGVMYKGKPFENRPYLSLDYGRVVEFASGEGPVEVEFDGDPGGYLPCRFEVARHRLDLICEGKS